MTKLLVNLLVRVKIIDFSGQRRLATSIELFAYLATRSIHDDRAAKPRRELHLHSFLALRNVQDN